MGVGTEPSRFAAVAVRPDGGRAPPSTEPYGEVQTASDGQGADLDNEEEALA